MSSSLLNCACAVRLSSMMPLVILPGQFSTISERLEGRRVRQSDGLAPWRAVGAEYLGHDPPSQGFGATGSASAFEALRFNYVPFDPHHAIIFEALERFWENKITRALPFLEPGEAKIGPAIASLNGHDPVVFDKTLQLGIFGRFLPKRVNLGRSGLLEDLSKACRFGGKQFHGGARRGERLQNERKPETRTPLQKNPPENYGKEDQTTVAAFLPWRGS